MLNLYIGNNNLVELDRLTNVATGAFDNAATVQVTLKDRAGNDVSGQVWPLSMPYVAASDGTYRGVLSQNLAVQANRRYTAVIDATGETGEIGHWEVEVRAVVRDS